MTVQCMRQQLWVTVAWNSVEGSRVMELLSCIVTCLDGGHDGKKDNQPSGRRGVYPKSNTNCRREAETGRECARAFIN